MVPVTSVIFRCNKKERVRGNTNKREIWIMCFLTEIMTPAGNNETLSPLSWYWRVFFYFLSCQACGETSDWFGMKPENIWAASCTRRVWLVEEEMKQQRQISRFLLEAPFWPGDERLCYLMLSTEDVLHFCHVNLRSNSFLHHGGDWTVTQSGVQRLGRVWKSCKWETCEPEVLNYVEHCRYADVQHILLWNSTF